MNGFIRPVRLDDAERVASIYNRYVSKTTITFEMALGDSAPTSSDPSISFEAYLDLVNPASGAGTNLADTLATDVTILATDQTPAPSGAE